MTKPTFETANFTDKNIEKIAKLFPNVITEIKDEKRSTPEKTVYKKGVNFKLLKQELSDDIVDGDECYDFNWVGKKACILEGNKPIKKTLRPCIEESKDWEHTGNLYIEGDNLDVLKLLQESYLNSVKMIYIDPPYNTGNDSFIYPDNFTMDKDDYEEQTEYRDDDDNINFKQNNAANPRFHSDWCSMMYPRLKLAQNLLTDDGVIFISIDDNEVHNLRKMCDEVFGESNRIADLIWNLKSGTQAGHFTRSHETILVYAKSKNNVPNFNINTNDSICHGALKKISIANPQSTIEFPEGFEFEGDNAEFSGEIGNSEKEYILDNKMIFTNGKLKYPTKVSAGWAMKNQLVSWINGKETYDSKGQKVIRFYFNKNGILFYEKKREVINPKTVIDDVGGTKRGSKDLIELLGAKYLNYPKPVELIKKLVSYITLDKKSIVLDFFSGSATTAQAVMQLNAEDGGNRKFIMVQLPEPCDEKSEAYKAGYKNICEIGKERIRRAGEKIKAKIEEENAQLKLDERPKKVPDIGFRVLKVDSTNMKEVYYSPEDYTQEMLSGMESNIKEDRTDLDLLYGVLLDWGLELTKNHKIVELYGVRVHCYDFDETESEDISNAALIPNCSLVACFEDKVGKDVIRAIAKSKPLRAVFRDSSFTDCPEKINVEEIFKYYAPDTSVKVI